MLNDRLRQAEAERMAVKVIIHPGEIISQGNNPLDIVRQILTGVRFHDTGKITINVLFNHADKLPFVFTPALLTVCQLLCSIRTTDPRRRLPLPLDL